MCQSTKFTENTAQSRLKSLVLRGILLVFLGLCYAVYLWCGGYGIPCPLEYRTGLQCPGCGVTRMSLALLKLEFKSAFMANPLLFSMIPVAIWRGIAFSIRYVQTGDDKANRIDNVLLNLTIILSVIWFVVRNWFL